MKVLLYSDGLEGIKNSGLGKAIDHQLEALKDSNIEYTLDSKCKDYDVVHINFYNPKAYLFAKKAHRLGKKVVYHAHSTEEDFRNSFPFSNLVAPLFKKWISICYKQGDYIVTPTDYSKKILETYKLGRPIYSLSNGIDISFFEKNEELGLKFRQDFNFTANDKIIMGVGLYFKRKGILEFIELARRMPEYKFIWFGANPLYMSPFEIRRALKTDLPNLFFPGYVEPQVLRGAYSGADLFIFPTKEETEGIPILEAFASKINTIVSDIPVFDWVNKNEEVYKAKDIDEFEKYIRAVLEKKLPSLIDNAYKKVSSKGIKRVGRQLISIYNQVYMEENNEIIIKQEKLNKKLALFFKEHGIKNFRITSIGNSIGSGYSLVRTTKPLLLRNETIEKIMRENGIYLERYHFARAQNNSDDHIFEWIQNNITESDIHKLNKNDYNNGKTSMPTHGLSQEKLEKYYPTDIKNDVGLRDLILETKEDLANIIIYNGCTGSFLDGLTRQGSISQQLMHGVKRDVYGLESTLKYIQSNNRNNQSNTQVYICGAPDFLGLKISELINHKLKKISQKYANTVYVNPVKSKFLYKSLDNIEEEDLSKLQQIFKKYLKFPDVHYDEEEYLKFNNNILETISNNYQETNSLINVDRELYKLSQKIEITNHKLLDDNIKRQNFISKILGKECDKINDPIKKKMFLVNAEKYLAERFPYDFYYLGKNEINKSIEEVEKKSK